MDTVFAPAKQTSTGPRSFTGAADFGISGLPQITTKSALVSARFRSSVAKWNEPPAALPFES
jgi:hypothetical protein